MMLRTVPGRPGVDFSGRDDVHSGLHSSDDLAGENGMALPRFSGGRIRKGEALDAVLTRRIS